MWQRPVDVMRSGRKAVPTDIEVSGFAVVVLRCDGVAERFASGEKRFAGEDKRFLSGE
jgi:hypothetical protein